MCETKGILRSKSGCSDVPKSILKKCDSLPKSGGDGCEDSSSSEDYVVAPASDLSAKLLSVELEAKDSQKSIATQSAAIVAHLVSEQANAESESKCDVKLPADQCQTPESIITASGSDGNISQGLVCDGKESSPVDNLICESGSLENKYVEIFFLSLSVSLAISLLNIVCMC